jgi:hypothetical protein
MQNRSIVAKGLRVVLAILLLHPEGLMHAQQDKVAAFKQAMAENQKRLSQYQWIETTIVSMKGEEKSRTQKLCFYGPDGKVQKQQISAPAQQQSPGGLKGKAVAKKKEEITDYMKQAVALVHSYVPPDPGRVQIAKESGKITASPGQGSVRLDFHDFVKPGDSMSLTLDTARYAIQDVSVKSYLDSQKDAVSLDVRYALLPDGVSYSARTLLNAPAKNIQVTVQNSDYRSMVQAQAPPPQKQQGPAPSPQQIDQLTGSIALYPDALIAQILDASTDPPQLKSFAGWLNQNSSLKGSALQEAAQKAGFDGPYIALAVFPQVVQMMDQKPEWTAQLGQAYIADSQAVSDSIQRLRKQAQAMGNLKTNQQQEVVTQKTSSGEQVIVIQPANPQIVYVPQYNPQVVYVQSAPPPSSSSASAAGAALIGFTAGIIVGAAANDHYYYGPYAWHRPPVAVHYNYSYYQQQRYENASNLQQQRYENASNLQANRQNAANQAQTTSQANQAQRQSTSQANQEQRQSTSQANQAQRQSSAQGMQSSAQANQAQRQSSLQAQQSPQQRSASTSTWGGGQSASQRSGMNSSSMSAYQSGATARSESARGSKSLSSSRKSGGGRSRSR